MIIENIRKSKILPVIALEKAQDAIPLCRALSRGGLEVAEITFRTAAAKDAIKLVASEFPGFILGAGTVTTVEELEGAREAGAQFALAPGFNPKIVRRAQEMEIPFFPGVATPTEIEMALECGCRILKFFPAGAMGGLSMIKALYAPYKHREIQFIPTGGVSAENIKEYMDFPGVIAVGGSWITDSKLINGQRWDEIARLTAEALKLIS